MPGLVGLITSKSKQWAEQQVGCMLGAMRHEPFYKTGRWSSETCGVYAGWAGHDEGVGDVVSSLTGRPNRVLLLVGERYPPIVPSDADGSDVLTQLNGRFHGLIVDDAAASAILFNDRYGMHRIYYHSAPGAFYFAAEAKAILAVRPDLREFDARALGEFVSCGCVLENRTLFKGIHVLPPASNWKFERGSLRQQSRYFEPQQWEAQGELEPDAYYREVRETFSRVLPRYFAGREKIGMSLTGGLDTRTVLAWQKREAGTLPCYTYGESGRECRDVTVARQVAALCNQPHHVIALGPSFLSKFAHYAERSLFLTDGCVDVTRAPDLYLSEQARQIAPVRMTGLYGDEVLRPQLRAFKPLKKLAPVFASDFVWHVSAATETYQRAVEGHPLSFAAFRQAPWHHFGALALEQTQLTVRTPFLDNDLIRTLYRAPLSATNDNDLRVRLIGDGDMALRRTRTDRGFAGRGGVLGWMSQNYHQFTFRAEYAYDYGMPQWLARIDHLVSPFRPERLFLGRHKLYHYRVWYRDVLSRYVREMLLDARTLARPFLDRQAVEFVVGEHVSGRQNFTTEIHRLLSLELLHRLFIDSRPTPGPTERRDDVMDELERRPGARVG